jgi:pyruvate dehydrogenase E1 component beta subunit
VPELKYAEAVRAALDAELAADESVLLLGEEIGALGGVFTVTQGLQERYGADRVLDSPICENGLVGWSIGAAVEGLRPVVEIMFSDFVILALDQVINMAAKVRYMSNGQFSVPLVLRMPGGGGTSHGPQHSQSLESIFAHTPGLTVALPSNALDAYWMLRQAIRSDDPVVFLESKYLYFRDVAEIDPDGPEPEPYRAAIARPGGDLTVVSAGRMTPRCLEAAEVLSGEGWECEVIDARYLWPLDTDLIGDSLQRTSKLAVVYEPVEFGGWGAEVAAWAAREHFDDLDAPITRLGAERVPIPAQARLEDEIVPSLERVTNALREAAEY